MKFRTLLATLFFLALPGMTLAAPADEEPVELPPTGLVKVAASPTVLTLTVNGTNQAIRLVELSPEQSFRHATNKTPFLQTNLTGELKITLPRFEGERDRIYSGFVVLTQQQAGASAPWGDIRYVEEFQGIAKTSLPLTNAPSKKGLQVQMVDDALALGIKHAALNFNLASLIQTQPAPQSLTWRMDGQTYYFDRNYLESIPVKRLSDAGARVTLIMLYYLGKNSSADAFMRHPNYISGGPNRLTAFNTVTPDGQRHFKACMEFLADYYSRTNNANGRVWGYIIGNEVNAHWDWYNLGNADRDKVVDDYLRTVRIANTAVRKSSANARVYLSLTHFWTEVYQKNPVHACSGKELLDEFARKAKLGGDFDWHLAFHPYPENLFEPRTWLDQTAPRDFNALKITFKNLEVLEDYLGRPEMLFHGRPRRVILSEQGFHATDKPDGETWQAAAYCYAYQKVERLGIVDAFIYHRQVDHRDEGGLNLGLWSRESNSVGTPGRKRPIYDAFLAADTPEWKKAFEFALPVIGISDWDQVLR